MITAFSYYNNKQIQLNSLKTMTHVVDLHFDYVRVFMCDDISSLIIKLAKSQHPEIIDITLKLILKVAIKAQDLNCNLKCFIDKGLLVEMKDLFNKFTQPCLNILIEISSLNYNDIISHGFLPILIDILETNSCKDFKRDVIYILVNLRLSCKSIIEMIVSNIIGYLEEILKDREAKSTYVTINLLYTMTRSLNGNAQHLQFFRNEISCSKILKYVKKYCGHNDAVLCDYCNYIIGSLNL